MPHISLVFREMWDSANLNVRVSIGRGTLRFVESHISRKTSEMWGTRHTWLGESFDVDMNYFQLTASCQRIWRCAVLRKTRSNSSISRRTAGVSVPSAVGDAFR